MKVHWPFFLPAITIFVILPLYLFERDALNLPYKTEEGWRWD